MSDGVILYQISWYGILLDRGTHESLSPPKSSAAQAWALYISISFRGGRLAFNVNTAEGTPGFVVYGVALLGNAALPRLSLAEAVLGAAELVHWRRPGSLLEALNQRRTSVGTIPARST
ncbi:hypothetical protein [Mesorhizobium amorphae]|uniref:hypothetical protein n=1 Tax=Mesorhizobium amorphae TaxID=71433 RepID=UPI00178467A4|nr:hypothetical protein [Mesorhizobium amorphae]